jgi:hypothetical protein
MPKRCLCAGPGEGPEKRTEVLGVLLTVVELAELKSTVGFSKGPGSHVASLVAPSALRSGGCYEEYESLP